MLKVKNTQSGPRGVNTVSGPVLINPGETAEVEIFEREKEGMDASGWFDIKGSYKANPDGAAAPAKASKAEIDKAVEAANAESDKAIAAKDAEIEELKKRLEAASKQNAGK